MRVRSHVCGGAKRMRDDTPKLVLETASFSMTYDTTRVLELKKWHNDRDVRLYEVCFEEADLRAILHNLCTTEGGRAMLREAMEAK